MENRKTGKTTKLIDEAIQHSGNINNMVTNFQTTPLPKNLTAYSQKTATMKVNGLKAILFQMFQTEYCFTRHHCFIQNTHKKSPKVLG